MMKLRNEGMRQESSKTNEAHLYPDDEDFYDQRDTDYLSSEDDESFYCERCDREFSSEDSLFEHKKEHKFCGIDGCTFSAHPLLVEKHIKMQHSSGLYNRIKDLSSPEDIEKWIMERKKKYPTKANIELRKAEELEKIQRGEIIKQKQETSRNKTKKVSRSRNRKRTVQKQVTKNNDIIQQKETYRGLPEFCGTLKLRNIDLQIENQDSNEVIEDVHGDSINCISDEDEMPASLSESVTTTFTVPNLVANYESSSEESNGPIEVPIKRVKLDDLTKEEDNVKKDQNEVIRDTHLSVNKQECSDPHLSEKPISTNSKSKNKRKIESKHQSKNKEQKSMPKKSQPYTSQLLQKLLSRSIQHERNLICQCVKYIVDNNFFD